MIVLNIIATSSVNSVFTNIIVQLGYFSHRHPLWQLSPASDAACKAFLTWQSIHRTSPLKGSRAQKLKKVQLSKNVCLMLLKKDSYPFQVLE